MNIINKYHTQYIYEYITIYIYIRIYLYINWVRGGGVGFPRGSAGKEPGWQCGRHERQGWLSGSGRSPGGGNSNPLQYS